MSGAVRPVLERFERALQNRFGDRLKDVTVFGSWARYEATEDSDLDVLVVIDALTDSERREVVRMAYDVDNLDDEPFGLSPLAYSTEQAAELRRRGRRLFADIIAEGVRL